VTVTAIPGIIAAGAKFTQVFQTEGNNADGIVATPDGSVLVNQEDNNAVVKIDRDDRASVFLSATRGSGSLSMDRQGRLLAVQRIPQPGTPAAAQPSAPTTAGLSMLLPERKIVADTFADGTKWTGRPNDLTADSTGGAYFTQGCVYYASATGTITLVGENLRTNGIVLGPNDRRLYVTNGTTIVAFDVQGPGRLSNRRDFATLEAGGNGDGITVDAAGRLYVSSGPGVQIFSPEGRFLGLIPAPRPLTGEVFAGPDRKTLYVVGNGATNASGQQMAGRTIYRIPMLAQGLMGRSK
jgi:gluconolactonase